jgi:hypothetical protein
MFRPQAGPQQRAGDELGRGLIALSCPKRNQARLETAVIDHGDNSAFWSFAWRGG